MMLRRYEYIYIYKEYNNQNTAKHDLAGMNAALDNTTSISSDLNIC